MKTTKYLLSTLLLCSLATSMAQAMEANSFNSNSDSDVEMSDRQHKGKHPQSDDNDDQQPQKKREITMVPEPAKSLFDIVRTSSAFEKIVVDTLNQPDLLQAIDALYAPTNGADTNEIQRHSTLAYLHTLWDSASCQKDITLHLVRNIPAMQTLLSPLCRYVLQGHINYINHVAITPDGTTAITASNDGTARVWDLTWYRFLSFEQLVLLITLQKSHDSSSPLSLNKKWTATFDSLPEFLKTKFKGIIRSR